MYVKEEVIEIIDELFMEDVFDSAGLSGAGVPDYQSDCLSSSPKKTRASPPKQGSPSHNSSLITHNSP